MAKTFYVTVKRVNEGSHQEAEFSTEAVAVSVDEDGSLRIKTEAGSQTHAATTWGAVEIVRVRGR